MWQSLHARGDGSPKFLEGINMESNGEGREGSLVLINQGAEAVPFLCHDATSFIWGSILMLGLCALLVFCNCGCSERISAKILNCDNGVYNCERKDNLLERPLSTEMLIFYITQDTQRHVIG